MEKSKTHFREKIMVKILGHNFLSIFSTLIFDGLNHQSYHAFFPRHHINYFKNISLGSIDYLKASQMILIG